MIQRYVIHNTSATVTVDGVTKGQAIAVQWCKSEDVAELEAKYAKLAEANSIALEALGYIARLYDDNQPTHLIACDAETMKNAAAVAFERTLEMTP